MPGFLATAVLLRAVTDFGAACEPGYMSWAQPLRNGRSVGYD